MNSKERKKRLKEIEEERRALMRTMALPLLLNLGGSGLAMASLAKGATPHPATFGAGLLGAALLRSPTAKAKALNEEKELLMQKRAEKKQRSEGRISIAPATLGAGLIGLGAGGKALADYASPKLRQRALDAYIETADIIDQGLKLRKGETTAEDALNFLTREVRGRGNNPRKTRLDDISAITKKYKKMLRNLSASEKVKLLRDARVRSALGITGAGSLYMSARERGHDK